MTAAKQHVPHYYVSIDINMAQVVKIRSQLNAESGSSLSVLDFTVKAAAAAMRQVPDLNGSWQETFVRRYEQVDINLVMGNNGTGLVTPIIRDVGGVGLKAISNVSFSICARD
jgi:pyruvate dehydrogenase E2 component (dihydrolipoamide acetyltransferase)